VDTTVHPANWSRGKIPHFLLHKKYFHYLSLFSVPKNARPNHHIHHAIHHKLTTKTPRFAHHFSQKPLQKPQSTTPQKKYVPRNPPRPISPPFRIARYPKQRLSTMTHPIPGRIEVITGPMFSGKSEELIRRLKRARIARQRVVCYKPDIDLRYHRTAIASHSSQTHEACTVTNVEHLKAELLPQLQDIDVIGIDEAQFFDTSIIPLTVELVHLGKRILIAGLDTTFNAEPFGPIPALMAISDEVTKLSAVCMVCGAPAIHTQRLGQSQELVLVGAAGIYEARCRTHFEPFSDEHHTEQLELLSI
jgi:thymidine kinase